MPANAQKVWLINGGRFDSESKTVAILPVGSVERHGNHLPLGTDGVEAEAVSLLVAERIGAHVFPPIWYGSSLGLKRFGGTIDIEPRVFYDYVKSVIREILRNGYILVLVVNGHGGNSYILREVAREIAYEYQDRAILVVDWWRDIAHEIRASLFKSPGHAGEDETSVMMYLTPDSVDMSLAKDHETSIGIGITVFSSIIDRALYPEAVLGKATAASPEKGKMLLDAVSEEISREVLKVLNLLMSKSSKNDRSEST
ncbi:MAG: creatininase family protein [Sulfolobales archaeon]